MDRAIDVEPFDRVVDQDGGLAIRGRVLLDSAGLSAYVNDGEHGVRRCELEPALALPEFAMRCELSASDDSAGFS